MASTDDPLRALNDWAAPLLTALSRTQVRQLARKLGQELRRSQSARIARQREPDGTPYTPRKPQRRIKPPSGRIRKQLMFSKLRMARHLKVIPTSDGVDVGFVGRDGTIATVHQLGLVDAVTPSGPRVRYPQRTLLGLTPEDRKMIETLLLDHLTQ